MDCERSVVVRVVQGDVQNMAQSPNDCDIAIESNTAFEGDKSVSPGTVSICGRVPQSDEINPMERSTASPYRPRSASPSLGHVTPYGRSPYHDRSKYVSYSKWRRSKTIQCWWGSTCTKKSCPYDHSGKAKDSPPVHNRRRHWSDNKSSYGWRDASDKVVEPRDTVRSGCPWAPSRRIIIGQTNESRRVDGSSARGVGKRCSRTRQHPIGGVSRSRTPVHPRRRSPDFEGRSLPRSHSTFSRSTARGIEHQVDDPAVADERSSPRRRARNTFCEGFVAGRHSHGGSARQTARVGTRRRAVQEERLHSVHVAGTTFCEGFAKGRHKHEAQQRSNSNRSENDELHARLKNTDFGHSELLEDECLASARTSHQGTNGRNQTNEEQSLTSLCHSFNRKATFLDVYNPLATLRLYDLKVIVAQMKASDFVREVQADLYEHISLVAPVNPESDSNGRIRLAFAHQQPPYFAVDTSLGSLLVTDIPCDQSFWGILNYFHDCLGLISVSTPKTLLDDAPRELRVRFALVEQAQAALVACAQFVKQPTRVQELQPCATMEALVLPPEMSHFQRLVIDQTLSEQIIRHLDKAMAIPSATTEAVLRRKGSVESKLDLQVLYLRRVHNFDFYSAAWFENEWDLFERCGAVVLRACPSHREPLDTEAWSRAHEDRLRQFLDSMSFERPSVPGVDQEPLRGRCATLCNQSVREVGENKFQCTRCLKQFSSSEFVHKHFSKIHIDLVDAERQAFLTEVAVATYVGRVAMMGA